MGDQKFANDIRQAKQTHERFLIAILTCEVFPKLEKSDPLASTEEDAIPDKYGVKWYEHQQKMGSSDEEKIVQPQNQKEEPKYKFKQI